MHTIDDDFEWDPEKAETNWQKHGVSSVRRWMMHEAHDFSKGRRGQVLKPPAGKTRITIRIDDDILEWFRKQIEATGHRSYQASINQVLREYMERQQEPLELILRRVVREELANYTVNPTGEQGSDDPS